MFLRDGGMDVFAGAYGDKRRAAAVGRLSERIIGCGSVVIREVGEAPQEKGGVHHQNRTWLTLSYSHTTNCQALLKMVGKFHEPRLS